MRLEDHSLDLVDKAVNDRLPTAEDDRLAIPGWGRTQIVQCGTFLGTVCGFAKAPTAPSPVWPFGPAARIATSRSSISKSGSRLSVRAASSRLGNECRDNLNALSLQSYFCGRNAPYS